MKKQFLIISITIDIILLSLILYVFFGVLPKVEAPKEIDIAEKIILEEDNTSSNNISDPVPPEIQEENPVDYYNTRGAVLPLDYTNEPLEIDYVYLPQPERIDMTDWTFCKLAKDYLNSDEEAFMQKYDRDMMLTQGNTIYRIRDYAEKINANAPFTESEREKYGIPDVWQTHSSNIFGLSFGNGYKGEVLQGVSIGTPTTTVFELWGQAQFQNEKLRLNGFKGNLFYIAVIGSDCVEKIYLQKYLPLPKVFEDYLILNHIGYFAEPGISTVSDSINYGGEYHQKVIAYMGLNDFTQLPYEELPMLAEYFQAAWGEVEFHSPYGFFGIKDRFELKPYYNISLSADFAGKVPVKLLESFPGYSVRDLDEAEGQLYRHVLWDMLIDKWQNGDAKVSPNGKLAFSCDHGRFYPYGGYHCTIYLFFLNENKPYQELDSGVYTPLEWLDDRTLICESSYPGDDYYEDRFLFDIYTGESEKYLMGDGQ